MSNRSAFIQQFRSIAGPAIKRECRFQGLLVAVDDQSFIEAHWAVMDCARMRGATYLPAALYDELADQVATWLVEAVDAVAPAVAEATECAQRVAVDIADYERRYAEAA